MSTENLDLHLPTSWSRMTNKEMETISECILAESKKISDKHAYNDLKVRTDIFLKLNKLTVLSHHSGNDENSVENGESYLVVSHRKISKPFRLYTYEIHYFITEHMRWMDLPSDRLVFPYPNYRHWLKQFSGPAVYMQTASWEQYRIACDCIELYVNENNRLVAMRQQKGSLPAALKAQEKRLNSAKAMFLSAIFNEKRLVVDKKTGLISYKYIYLSSQVTTNMKCFRDFSDVKFQVILFWWSGLMNYLKKKYPRVFKENKGAKKQKAVNPFELYTTTITTLEKYLGLKEADINSETYTNTLKQLDNMMAENEAYERSAKKVNEL